MSSIASPIARFSRWYEAELQGSTVSVPSAVCLSTIGLDGFPNARFISFKDIIDDAFVITGPMHSRKGKEIKNNAKVALTFWWPITERQVRIQGEATVLPDQLADRYFDERHESSKAVSLICEQGQAIDDMEPLERRIEETVAGSAHIKRPGHWGGYLVTPIRMEFMEFKTSRFHDRKLYMLNNGNWHMQQIQP